MSKRYCCSGADGEASGRDKTKNKKKKEKKNIKPQQTEAKLLLQRCKGHRAKGGDHRLAARLSEHPSSDTASVPSTRERHPGWRHRKRNGEEKAEREGGIRSNKWLLISALPRDPRWLLCLLRGVSVPPAASLSCFGTEAPSEPAQHSPIPDQQVVTDFFCPKCHTVPQPQPYQVKCCEKISFSLTGGHRHTRQGHRHTHQGHRRCASGCLIEALPEAESEPSLNLSLFLMDPKPKHRLIKYTRCELKGKKKKRQQTTQRR